MSTSAKGDRFEQRVYNALRGELRKEALWGSSKNAKIFRKKAYFSRDRGSDIIADVSIEFYLPKRKRPSLLWVFECKDYRGSIPVDDVEEFHAKLQQIGEDNTKGTFVTSGALQRSALAFARSKRIGVIRLLPDDQLEHVAEILDTRSMAGLSRFNWQEFEPALTDPQHRSRRNFFATDDGCSLPSWHSVISYQLSPGKAAWNDGDG